MTDKLSTLAASLILFALFAQRTPAAERQVLQGHVPAAVRNLNLQPVGRLPRMNRLHIAIELPLRNKAALSNLLEQLYNPRSTNFHRFLKPEQFTERFGPTEQDYQSVIGFVRSNGLTLSTTPPGRTMLPLDLSVAEIEKIFHVTMLVYQHPTEARTFYAPDVEPSLDLDVPVLAIAGLNNYVTPHRSSHHKPATASAGGFQPGGSSGGYFIGTDFRHAYVPDTSLTGTGQTVGLLEEASYNAGDIQKYETIAGITSFVQLQNVILPAGTSPISVGSGNGEVCLDIEMAIAMAPGLSSVVVFEDNDGNAINEIVTAMANTTNTSGGPLCLQLSSSWSSYVDASTPEKFQQLAAQGQSFFEYSGDGGAFVATWGPYPIGTNGCDSATEPYMTLVGGTELSMNTNGASWQSESVWDNPPEGSKFASGGGLFTAVPIPDYQEGVNMSAVGGSPLYRNAPDVAMCADQIRAVFTGQDGSGNYTVTGDTNDYFWGTSAAAPLWAGFTALVNQQATAQGKPSVGFLNPALYAIGQGPNYANCFHDITVGNNTNSSSTNLFFAAPGYDLCTGWGSPKGQNLINALVGFLGPGSIWVDFNYTGSPQNGTYDYPYNTLAQGTNAVSSGGTIIIKTAGSSPGRMTISKPMTIISVGGAATVGQQ